MGMYETLPVKRVIKNQSGGGRAKRARLNQNSGIQPKEDQLLTCSKNILSLPVEILLLILSYLPPRDLQTLRLVSSSFEQLARDPFIWKAYEALNDGTTTSEIIRDLKNMPLIKKIIIDDRMDCDYIIKQLSRSNKYLEEIRITFITDADISLRSANLIRVLEKCQKLHTIHICGARFRSLKFYRILGNIGYRLKSVSIPATCTQFRTFAIHVDHIDEKDREIIFNMGIGGKSWGPMQYFMVERKGQSHTVLISHLFNDFLAINVNATPPLQELSRRPLE